MFCMCSNVWSKSEFELFGGKVKIHLNYAHRDLGVITVCQQNEYGQCSPTIDFEIWSLRLDNSED